MKVLVSVLLATTLFAGCSTYQPVPEGYKGATATISDSGRAEDASKAQLFALTEIEGNRIMNSFWASSNASYGKGFALTVVISERQVPSRPMKVALRGSHTTAAPIHAIASKMAGSFHSVEGVVDFTPKPNGRYVVKGDLKKDMSSVWIEDAETGQIVTEKIVQQ